jgi:virginiamycin B lyase
MRRIATSLACCLLPVAPLAAQQAGAGNAGSRATPQDQAPPPISEWSVPFGENTRPRDPAVAPDGRIWFVGQVGNYLAVFDPKTSAFNKFALEDGALPHSNVVAPDGTVWYTGNGNGSIGRMNPKTGEIRVIRLPQGVRDPHTMAFDTRGGMWFTVQNANYIGYLNIGTEQVKTIAMPASSRPYGIVMDHDRPYFDLFGTNQIATVDPATFEVKTYPLPDPGSRPRRIGRTTDGAIWYGDYTKGRLGRLDPKTGKVEEWPNPSGPASLPYAMAVDDADRIWYVETGVKPNRLVAFDSKTKQVVHNAAITPSLTGANVVRHMVFDPKTRTIWFGTDNNFLGMVKVPPKPAM